jgi:biopolymer transport protein ExbB
MDRLRPSPLGSIVQVVLSNRGRARTEVEEAVMQAGRSAAASLERGIGLIEIAAATAPLLGLLGTVVGMVEVFGTISLEGVGEAQAFSGGIKKALYTTVAGLTVGIPSLAFFIYFSRCVERRAIQMEQAVAGLLNRLYPKAAPSAGAGPLRPRPSATEPAASDNARDG